MKTIQSFILFSVLVGFLLQILGDMQLNRYMRFFGGLIFVLLLISPVYELITKEDVSWNISLRSLWIEYEEAQRYEGITKGEESAYSKQAVEVLKNNMDDYLNGYGYEIMEYDVIWSESGEVDTLTLYVIKLGSIGVSVSMTKQTEKASELKKVLVENYEPGFVLEVYCDE